MSKHDYRVTLRQMEEYAGRAQEICADKTLDELMGDWQATLALERALEVLGEAVKRLPNDLRNRYTQVEWRAIAGMRDRLIHGYDFIKHEILWNAVHEQLPTLRETIQQMLDDSENGDPAYKP